MKLFRNLTIYRIAPGWVPDIDAMDATLGAAEFTPCGATQDKSVGWVPPRGEDHGALVESVAGQHILKLQIQTKSVPKSLVHENAREEARNIENATGRKPGKEEMKALREDALLALLPQAFPKNTAVLVWIDPVAGLLMADATSTSALDELVTALVRSFDGLALSLLQTAQNPMSAMTGWLAATDPADWPGEFSIERACELRSGDEEKSVVKFNRHNLVTDEVRQHISQGKLPKWTAMSYDGRVSFVLDDCLRLKQINFLEGVFENRPSEAGDSFDTDIALVTGELRHLIDGLIDALGGELVFQPTPHQPTA